uniref:Cystatin domain-containing protein n=1 Tax=Trichogramma kaykai TaxID=54128 RepID=A0ABD2W6P6_9HYME
MPPGWDVAHGEYFRGVMLRFFAQRGEEKRKKKSRPILSYAFRELLVLFLEANENVEFLLTRRIKNLPSWLRHRFHHFNLSYSLYWCVYTTMNIKLNKQFQRINYRCEYFKNFLLFYFVNLVKNTLQVTHLIHKIDHAINFNPQVPKKGKLLVESGHVKNVKEYRLGGTSYKIEARVIRQTSTGKVPYKVELQVSYIYTINTVILQIKKLNENIFFILIVSAKSATFHVNA